MAKGFPQSTLGRGDIISYYHAKFNFENQQETCACKTSIKKGFLGNWGDKILASLEFPRRTD